MNGLQVPNSFTVVELALLLMGLLLILIATAFSGRLPAKQLSWSSEKFGSLQLDLVPLLILVGLVLAGGGLYSSWRATDAKLAEAAAKEERLNALRAQFEDMKLYRVTARLGFEVPVRAGELKVTAFIDDNSTTEIQRIVHPKQGQSANEIVVTLDGLRPHWRVYFKAIKDNKTAWETIPADALQPAMEMHRSEPR